MLLRARSIALRARNSAISSSSLLHRRSLADQQTRFPTYFQTPPPPPSYKPRYFRGGLYAILSFGLVYGSVTLFLDRFINGPPESLEKLSKELDALPLVQAMREEAPLYQEWQAYSNFNDEEKKHRLTSGPMGGVRGVGMQRVFWNEKQKTAVTVIRFGPAVSGWPRTTHGGTLSTIMDESMGRVALRSFPAGTGVTANLNMSFRMPVRPGIWYVLATRTGETTERKATVNARLEDLHGRICVEATGIFVVPKTLTLKKITGEF